MSQSRIGEGLGSRAIGALYRVVPNLDRLDIKSEAVHGVALQGGFLAQALAYGTAYTVLVLLLACLAFQRKEFA